MSLNPTNLDRQRAPSAQACMHMPFFTDSPNSPCNHVILFFGRLFESPLSLEHFLPWPKQRKKTCSEFRKTPLQRR